MDVGKENNNGETPFYANYLIGNVLRDCIVLRIPRRVSRPVSKYSGGHAIRGSAPNSAF